MIDDASARRLRSMGRLLVSSGDLSPYGQRLIERLVVEESGIVEPGDEPPP